MLSPAWEVPPAASADKQVPPLAHHMRMCGHSVTWLGSASAIASAVAEVGPILCYSNWFIGRTMQLLPIFNFLLTFTIILLLS